MAQGLYLIQGFYRVWLVLEFKIGWNFVTSLSFFGDDI